MLALSVREIDSSRLFGIYLPPLYIVHGSIVSYIELTVTEDLGTWYFVTLYIYSEVFCSLPFLETDGHITGTESGSKAGRVVYCAEAGIGIRTVESLVEKDYAVIAVEHQIAGVDCAGLVCGGGKRGG